MPINSLVSLLIQCITLYYYPHFVMHTENLPSVLFALKIFILYTNKNDCKCTHMYVWQNWFTCKISRNLRKKFRAARTKDGTVGLIIWHSRSYNKSYDYRIKISGRSSGGSHEASQNSNTTPPFYPARRMLL